MTIALWCVLAAAFLPLLAVGAAKTDARYDNAAPRRWSATLKGWRARAHAAQTNGFEAFPFFAAAVLAAQVQHAPQPPVDALAVAWIALRLVYTGLYVADRAALRSLVWLAALAVAVAIFLAPLWA